MEKLEPYINFETAIKSLDNGGQFYNFAAKAEDGLITQSELGKVGGWFADNQQLILFLQMFLLRLSPTEKDTIISKLDASLKEKYQKYKAQELLPSEANLKGTLSSNAIITGFPKMINSKSDFNGFIMIPIITVNVTSFMMIPMMDEYDIYELRDEVSSEMFIIAHLRDAEKLPSTKMIIAGVLKELNESEEQGKSTGKFLEAIYCVDY